MDSLLANYASSDDEEQEQPPPSSSSKPTSEHGQPISSKTHSLFSSLPQPKSSSLLQSLTKPKQSSSSRNALSGEDDSETRSGSIAGKSSSIFSSSLPQSKSNSINPSAPASSTMSNDIYGYEVGSINTNQSSGRTSLFSSLPKPKSQIEQEPAPRVSASGPSAKKVIQFRPPIIPLKKSSEVDYEEEEEEEEERKAENERKKLESTPQTSSVKSFLSSIPAPRNSTTLGIQGTSGSGRRSIIETDAPGASNADGSVVENNVNTDQNGRSYESHSYYQYGNDQNPEYYMDSNSYGNYGSGIDDSVGDLPEAGTANTVATASYYVNNDAYASYNIYGDYEQYGNNWADGYGATVPEMSGMSDNGLKVSGKRGRSEIPSEIIEVKQEELIKNRPREDQVKLTGIAFGPSYQPVSAKGKPSKLHRRKHQIGSLYFDMKQKESELSERRAKGMLTKAETQAKYGW